MASNAMTEDPVRAYYAALGEREWHRLTNPGDGAVEWALTCHMLTTYLPATGRVLDLGGGPGRYTIWLAQRGYRVVLADLSASLLALARDKIAAAGVTDAVEAVVEADACDLSAWPDQTFDAVVCLGPFYHLTDPLDRSRAASELSRLLQPGGTAFVAFMPRSMLLRRILARPQERHHVTDATWMARLMREGVFDNDVPGHFTHGYGAVPSEIAPFWAQYGLRQLALIAAEGITGGLQEALAELQAYDARTYQAALELVIQTADDPSILGMANHLLYVGRKG